MNCTFMDSIGGNSNGNKKKRTNKNTGAWCGLHRLGCYFAADGLVYKIRPLCNFTGFSADSNRCGNLRC